MKKGEIEKVEGKVEKVRVMNVKIQQPKLPANEFLLRGQGKSASCSYSPY
jgi:hypothetical protein